MAKTRIDNAGHVHVERVLSTVSKSKQLVSSFETPSLIDRSWDRCLNQHRISPDLRVIPDVLENYTLRQYQDAFADVHEIAENSVEKLFSLIADIGYTVLLTDKNGITLDCRYDPECERELKAQGLYTGTNWSEDVAGTNGIGTCLVEESSVIIRKEEHFFPTMLDMTCTVSPIFDSKGKLIASLDATTLHPETVGQNRLISKLVEQHARQIEALYFVRQHANHWLLRFSTFKDTADNLTTGILAIDEDGIIVAGNRNGLSLISRRAGYTIKNCAFQQIFDTTFSQLLNDFSKKLSHQPSIRSLENGIDFYYSLVPPVSRSSSPQERSAVKKSKAAARASMTLDSLVGNDRQMQITADKVKQIINMDLHMLIIGETGSGKEAMAQAIHNESLRKDKPFVAINCAAIPDSLIESELFGYSSGTFTGALKKGMKGKILQANSGTLFLDEIGDMPLHLQTRLLRVLSEMEVVPLGESSPIPLDIQLISATNKDVAEMIEENIFRSDLYFRLNGATFELPALRQRTDKQELITRIFNAHARAEPLEISEGAIQQLVNYSWPGNIRQLINVAKYANAMCTGDLISTEHLPREIQTEDCSAAAQQNVQYSEYESIMKSLKDNKWNITKVSKELDICRATVYRKMKTYNIVPPNDI